MMNSMTSTKLLNGFPCRDGGGLDCRPTLATIRGWVTIVAMDLDIAPSTNDRQQNRTKLLALI